MGAAPPVILVVEDEPATAELLRELLEDEGYLVETVVDGATALARVQAGGIDLVLLDIMLPRLDGLRLCRLLRELEDGDYRPILVLTAVAGDATRHAGFLAGADDYLAKPFKNDELLDRVRVWVRTRQRLQAAQAPSSPQDAPPHGPVPSSPEELSARAVETPSIIPAPYALDGTVTAPLAPGGDSLEDAVRRHEGFLYHLVAEAEQRPWFLAALLVPYARAQGWDEAQLARALGCPLATLPRLLLCRRPLPLTWETDVATAAYACGADPAALAALLRAAGAGEMVS